MTKLPVGQTIAEAYRFTFGHLGTIIGLIWLPVVLSAILNFLPEISGSYGDQASNPIAASTGALESIAVLILTQLLYAIIYVAVTRQALGLRQGPAVVHFALGPPEFRMFGATMLFLLVSFGCALVFSALFFGFIAVAASQAKNTAAVLLGFLAVLGGVLGLVYVLVRFGFLLIPVTVVENRVDLSRSWALAQGNFWRIVLVLLAIVLPVAAIEIAGMYVLMGKEILAALPPVGSSDAVIQQHLTQLQEIIRPHAPEVLGMSLILAPFNLGLTISASAYAYRALAPEGQREVRT